MKRPMIALAAAWLAGILIRRWLPGGFILILFGYIFLFLLFLFVLRRNPALIFPYVTKKRYGAMTVFFVCLPLLFCGGYLRQQVYEENVAKNLSGWQQTEQEGLSHVIVTGTVTGKAVDGEKIVLTLSECRVNEAPAGNCRVSVEKEGSDWMEQSKIGNRVRVYGKFYLYKEAANPGQFDAASYYHGKGWFASVTALRLEVISEQSSWTGQTLYLVKQRLRAVLTELYPAEKAGVLSAMLLGEKDMLSEEVEQLYRQNGISHILAISGLHISMLVMGLFRLLRKIGMPPWPAVLCTVSFLLFYVIFTGAGTSSLRAGIMCLVLLPSTLFRRSYDLLSSLSFAAIVVTAVRPQDMVSAGFLLSFGAVLGVAVAQEIGRSSLFTGGLLSLFTMPVSLWFYYEWTPYSVLLNLLIIPLAAFVLGGGVCSVLLGLFTTGPAQFVAGGVYVLLDFYEWLCRMVQLLPYSFVLTGRPDVWQIMLYVAGLAATLWYMKKRKPQGRQRWFSAAGILCSLGVLLCPRPLQFTLSFLDVSQGDGIFLQTDSGKVLFFDGGSTDSNAVGKYRISPFLKEQGIALIDIVAVSHMDKDHYSGILELLEEMPVYRGRAEYLRKYSGAVGLCELVLPKVEEPSEDYLALVKLCREKNVAVRYLAAGEELYREDHLRLECLSPVNAEVSENDTSLVFLLQTPELAVWLTGDAGVSAEEAIIRRLGGPENPVKEIWEKKCCILKVGHHGSNTSSGASFLSYTEPDIAVISCGYENSYGHPHAEVVWRLTECGCEIYRTDLQGCINVRISKSGSVCVDAWRKDKRSADEESR